MNAVMAVNTIESSAYALDFATCEFTDDCVKVCFAEGVNIDSDKMLLFYALCSEVFTDKPFSVIELRYFSYSVDPLFYIEYRNLLSNIKSHAIVAVTNRLMYIHQYELDFIKHCPSKAFSALDDAVEWCLAA